jgi:hypothetical protein
MRMGNALCLTGKLIRIYSAQESLCCKFAAKKICRTSVMRHWI